MIPFDAYAEFYDLLYGDKNYELEASFVHSLLREFNLSDADILEIGSGTGKHARHLAGLGFSIWGIDSSPSMVKIARHEGLKLPDAQRERLHFSHGDVRNLNLGRQFGAAISLFHVVSYLTTDEELNSGFAALRRHLDVGGLFIFDFWHAPAIANSGPMVREKIVESDIWQIHRLTNPIWIKNRDIAKINFHLTAKQKKTGETRIFHEEHVMRYFFPEKIESMLLANGFVVEVCEEWLTRKKTSHDSFNVYMVARAV